jgi:hypothetical protein
LLGTNFSAQLFSSLRKSGLDDAEAVFRRWLGEVHGSAPAGGQAVVTPALGHSEAAK